MRSLLVGLIRLYRVGLRPLLVGGCRYAPSCSEYAIQVIGREGVWHGSIRAGRRLLRCHPFARGGLDLP